MVVLICWCHPLKKGFANGLVLWRLPSVAVCFEAVEEELRVYYVVVDQLKNRYLIVLCFVSFKSFCLIRSIFETDQADATICVVLQRKIVLVITPSDEENMD